MDPSPYYDDRKEQFINENEFVDLGPLEETDFLAPRPTNGAQTTKMPS